MAYTLVTLPLTGAGDATAAPAVDLIGGAAYQAMKLVDGAEGSTEPVRALGTTPGATDHGLVTRPIGSTAHLQGIAGSVTVANPTTAVNVANTVGVVVGNPTTSVSLSSVHTVTVGNPTTAVTVSSGVVLGAGSSANVLGAMAQGAGSTSIAPWYVISSAGGGGSTAVDLSSGGSTRLVGMVSQGTPGGSSADAWWVRTVTTGAAGAGSTTVDANLTSAGSTKTIGIVDGEPFSSGAIARTTHNTSAEQQLLAANANRKYASITNITTGFSLYCGLSTAAVTTAGANVSFIVPPLQTFTLGGQLGNMPRYTGPIRGKLGTTTVAGPAAVVEFS